MRGRMKRRRMKALQGSCFLISSPPTNTVLVSPQCFSYSCILSSVPLLAHTVTVELCFQALSFRILVCSCFTDDDYYEDDEEDDPDALKDPIYQIDLQVY